MKRGGMKRRDFLKSSVALAAGSAFTAPAVWSAKAAASRKETLLMVTENGPNNLDIQGLGTNRPGYEASWNCYDRLIKNATKTLPDGSLSYDRDKFEPELAEDMKVGDMSVTFKLKKNAKFQDGTPVTAKDVKWSFERAISVGGFPTVQMKAGSLMKKEQFVAVDDHTFRVDFIKKDRLTIPDLAVIVPGIYNSELIKKHASPKDPWGRDYTKANTAGSGAYKVVSWKPGVEVVYERYDGWVGGKKPELKRVIWRTIPSSGNRRALMERGDADISFDLPAKDFAEMKKEGKVNIISTPISNGMYSVELNVVKPPFNNEKVRQALAYAMPYQKIMDAAMFGLANPLFGGKSNQVGSIAWPQPTGYATDLEKAKALMKEAGVGDISTTISLDLGDAVTSRADRRTGAGKPRPYRHQEHHQQGAGLQLAQRNGQEADAADGQLLLRLARLSGILLLLVLFRPERDLQHAELCQQGHGRDDQRRARRRRDRRQGNLRQECRGLHQQGLCRGAAHSAVPALPQRGDAEEHLRLHLLVPPPARLPLDREGVIERRRLPRKRGTP